MLVTTCQTRKYGNIFANKRGNLFFQYINIKYIAHTTIRVIYSQTFLNDPWKTWLGRRGTHIMFKFEPDIKNHILGQQKTLIFSFTTKSDSAGKEQFLVLLNFPQKS